MLEEIINYLKAIQIHDWIQTIGIIILIIQSTVRQNSEELKETGKIKYHGD